MALFLKVKVKNTLAIFTIGILIISNCSFAQTKTAFVSDELELNLNKDIAVLNIAGDVSQATENWSFHAQGTYIEQRKNNFYSPYSGPNSLMNQSQGDSNRAFTGSITAYLGTRLWTGAEAYYNTELFEGTPFSNALVGLGGFQNGELQKGIYIPAVIYSARAFVRQTVNLGGGEEWIEAGVNNQLAGAVDKNRLVFTFGKVASLDFFDSNTYSHDPRLHFLNFSTFSSAALGFAGDARGFTYGLISELYRENWIIRGGRLAMPTSPNIMQLDYTLSKDYIDQIEITRSHEWADQPGKLRAITFKQHAYMASYQDAITQGEINNGVPNILTSRIPNRSMFGYGLNAEQAINSDIGIFARWSWNNDQTETQTLDVGRSVNLGASIRGSQWGRAADTWGVAIAINAISDSEVQYLKKGGVTMFIGDGAIVYKPEQIQETYYSAKLIEGLYLSTDFQRIANPAYNASRGPVNVVSLRLHYEF